MVDRAKDMIISGGVNIFPTEIEDVLVKHPDVVEAAVIGRPIPKWGEIVTAYVVTRKGVPVPERELNAWCRETRRLQETARLSRARRAAEERLRQTPQARAEGSGGHERTDEAPESIRIEPHADPGAAGAPLRRTTDCSGGCGCVSSLWST